MIQKMWTVVKIDDNDGSEYVLGDVVSESALQGANRVCSES